MTDVQSQSHADRVYDWWSRHPGLFDLFATAAFFGRYRSLRRMAVDRLGLERGDRVLDLACGTGPNFPLLVEAVGSGGTVVGLDHSRGMAVAALQRAHEAGDESLRVARADAGALPLPDDAMDAALCTLSLSAIPDHLAAIQELRRVVRPGGRVVVLDAQPYQSGPIRVFNPLVNRVSALATNWYPDRHLPTDLRAAFGADRVDVDCHNGGTAFVATVRVPESL
ncbi:class I SAM-dependent methyltransferase [Haloglomus litoreum]|uniref:class I SAM-dependent methyltransferase n=1 Tax=Haloglomus litoreum TaxID=3034026 RepID=UPI0023E80D86|nr:class I SAM-dependent methyltransferase [Haloglomus sp. DT116]